MSYHTLLYSIVYYILFVQIIKKKNVILNKVFDTLKPLLHIMLFFVIELVITEKSLNNR